MHKHSGLPLRHHDAEDVLKKLDKPVCNCEVTYGDPTQPNYISRLRYHTMFIKKWTMEVAKRSPKNADLKSWRY